MYREGCLFSQGFIKLFGLLGGSNLGGGSSGLLSGSLLRSQDGAGTTQGGLGEVLAVLHGGELLLQLAERPTGSSLEYDLGDVFCGLVDILGLLVDQLESPLLSRHHIHGLLVHQAAVPERADVHQVAGFLEIAMDKRAHKQSRFSFVIYRAEGLRDVGLLQLEGIVLAHDQPVQVGRRSSHFDLKRKK